MKIFINLEMTEKYCFFYIFCLALFTSSISCAEGALGYSLQQKSSCQMSPKSPPKSVFSKSYKIYTYPGPWTIVDINGDGWCDWVRSGHEGYRTDEEEPVLRDFIYLGTSHGWRNYDSPKNPNNFTSYNIWEMKSDYLLSSSKAVSFYEPIPVYINDEKKPYMVTAIRYDAPAPPPDYDQVLVTRWDGGQDALKKVSGEEKEAIWNFLRKALCNRPRDDYEKMHSPRIITLGALCKLN
jgi:hypothetical protein